MLKVRQRVRLLVFLGAGSPKNIAFARSESRSRLQVVHCYLKTPIAIGYRVGFYDDTSI